MKIRIFIGGLSGGGAERVCCNIANFLADKKHEVEIITMADDKATYGLSSKVHRMILLSESERKGFIYNSVVRYKRLKEYVRKTKCDVYIVMLPITILLLLSLKRFTKAKIIASERNMPTLYPKWQQIAMKWIASKVDGWVFQTEEQKEWYGNHLGQVHNCIIPNAINEQFILEPYIGERKNKIVTVGRLMPQKNQELLLRAFAKVAAVFPIYKLHIYGDGPLKSKLLQVAKELDIEDKIEFEGFISNISEKIKDAALFVLSSDFEGMPNALIEAMALGVPCISTDCNGGGAKYLIDNGVNGILVPKNDIAALSKGIIEILENPSKASKFGLEANKVCVRLHPQVVYSKWEDFVKQINKTEKL